MWNGIRYWIEIVSCYETRSNRLLYIVILFFFIKHKKQRNSRKKVPNYTQEIYKEELKRLTK